MAAGGNTKTRGEFSDYDSFVEKFKPKKTTDDCYTPENIYDTVADYVAIRYGISREDMVRPFWPGGNYELFDYPDGCCVVDNPPFLICKQICRDFQEWHVKFFLFCPYLTAGGLTKVKGTTLIIAPVAVVYENGAEVSTCFITNMEPEVIARGDVGLMEAIDAANNENLKAIKKQVPKYDYPDEVLTVQKIGWFTIHHTPFTLSRSDCCHIDQMDAQRAAGKSVFGTGFLLSERAAAERAAAERAAAERAAAERAAATKWKLSERERKIIALMERT